MTKTASLYGMDSAIRLVREFMDRPDEGRVAPSRRQPVLMFTGPHGIGKTALLEYLEQRLQNNVPHACIDFADTADTHPRTPYDVLTRLAYDLNKKYGLYGRLAFPRLTVGLIAKRQEDIDREIPSRARAQMRDALLAARKITNLMEALSDAAPPALELLYGLGVPSVLKRIVRRVPRQVFRQIFRLAFILLAVFRPGRWLLFGRGLGWYADRDADAFDTLVDLNQWAHAPDEGNNRARVSELLMEAFLADLRSAFGHGRQARRLPLNGVLLLDNADSPLGEEFIDKFLAIRQKHDKDPDPLTVVTTGRKAPPSGKGDEARDVGDEELRSIERWRYTGRLSVRLRDLTESEVESMVSERLTRRNIQPHIHTVIYQFTAGHPHSTRFLVNAFGRRDDPPEALPDVLDGKRSRELQADLLRDFLGDQDDLITCAAARNRREANRLAASSELLDRYDSEIRNLFRFPGDRPGENATLQPALRRLLLRRLADRTDDEPNGWNNVHTWLCDTAADDETRLHHTLALGQVEPVARQLAGEIDKLSDTDWLTLLANVTGAPIRSPVASPLRTARDQTAWVRRREIPLGPVAYLVSDLWILADPLTGFERKELHRRVARAYDDLVPHMPDGGDVLVSEAAHHRRLAKRWPSSATDPGDGR